MDRPTPPRRNPLAVGSLISAVAAFPTMITWFFFESAQYLLLVVALWALAIVLGHAGLSRIKNSNGAFQGKGFAIAGLCIGYGWLTIGMVFIAIIAPPIGQLRLVAQQTKCINNLRQIVNASLLHAAINEETFPSTLQQLTEHIDDPNTFQLPCSKSQPGELSKVDQWSGYTFIPNRSMMDPRDTILAYCSPDCWGGKGGHIAYLGGNVSWHSAEEFYDLVAGLKGE